MISRIQHHTSHIFFILLIASLTACHNANLPQRGDLIFEIATDSDMSNAISEATAQTDSLKFSHVGIIDIDSVGNMLVIEATGKHGVVSTPIDSFMYKAKSGAVVKRLDIPYQVDQTIIRAKSYLGRGYDWWYSPDNEEIYCSELVEKSYMAPDGSPIFSTIIMNFRDAQGNMPQFWTDLFAKLGTPIPEGLPGTNPTQISKFQSLKTICTLHNNGKQ